MNSESLLKILQALKKRQDTISARIASLESAEADEQLADAMTSEALAQLLQEIEALDAATPF